MKKYISLALASTAIALSFNSCGGSNNASKEAETSKDSVQVFDIDTATATLESIDLSEQFTATLQAKVKNNISAQTGGRLMQLLVKVGDRVSQGQVVARLEATQLSTAQIQLNDAKTNLQRMDELYKAGGISKAQWEQARSAVSIAQQTVSNLATNTSLRSPISGVVTAKNYENGDMTSPSLPVVVIEQISPVKTLIHVSERHYSTLKKGLKAQLIVEALGASSFEGYVSNVYPTIDAATHTIAVEVEFANKDLSLRPGMYGSVKLDLGSREAIVVPDKAVQRTLGAGTRFVYIVKGNKVEHRVVELGRKVGDKQEIISGINAGEIVATQGASNLSNGALVK